MFSSAASHDRERDEEKSAASKYKEAKRFVKKDYQALTKLINSYRASKDTAIYSAEKHLATLNDKQAVLYPCSGGDVSFPLNMLPSANVFVLVDEHDFLPSVNNAYEKLLAQSLEHRFPSGLGFIGTGYDYTSVHNIIARLSDDFDTPVAREPSIAHIMLSRLRQNCGLTITSIEPIVEAAVYRIEGTIADQQKTIYYVSHYFGKEGAGYDWLLKQKFDFQLLYVKAFAPSINDNVITVETYAQIKALIDGQSFQVLTEQSGGYAYNKNYPQLFKPDAIKCVVDLPDFGYSATLAIADNHAFYAEYPIHMSQLKHEAILERQRANQRHMRALMVARMKKEAFISTYESAEPKEALKSLRDKRLISLNGEQLTLHVAEFIKQDCIELLRTTKYISKFMGIMAGNGISALNIEFNHCLDRTSDMTYQELAAALYAQLSESDKAIKVFTITVVGRRLEFRSDAAIQLAQIASLSDYPLDCLSATVNSRGAKAFYALAEELRKSDKPMIKALEIKPNASWNADILKLTGGQIEVLQLKKLTLKPA